ncbi:MAG: radical SAM family heme chaperone HemW [Armatimonadota bacterium]
MTHPSPQSAYIHIPFCARKCLYCDFTSYPGMESSFAHYVDALRCEIRRSADRYTDSCISTIYLGGGTPVILPPEALSQILDEIRDSSTVDADAEITIETNPGMSVDYPYLRDAGSNRLSMGVQSFHNDELRLLGRIHSSEDAVSAFQTARNAGFQNISIDLMYGIPGQTMASWMETLHRAVDLASEHISLYSLTIEEGTPFHRMMEQGDLHLPGDDIETDMYEAAIRKLTECGYEQYEISSFAKPGFRCRHNITYWWNEPYFGFGAGASSYLRGVRASNTVMVDDYISRVRYGESPIDASEALSERESMGETIFLGLRMCDGVDTSAFERRYGMSIHEAFGEQIEMLSTKGMLIEADGFLRLPRRGLLFSNDVFAEFV